MKIRSERRVVITGLGLVSSLGPTTEPTWRGVLNGECGIRDVTRFDTTAYPSRRAAELSESIVTDLAIRAGQPLSLLDLIAVSAFREALADSRLAIDPAIPSGLVFGGGSGSFVPVESELIFSDVISQDSGEPHPDLYNPASPAEQIRSMHPGLSRQLVPMTACSSASVAIGFAFDAVRTGMWEVAFAGGADVISRLCFGGFNTLRAMDPDCCKPFDRRRIGMSLGEGAGVLVLESLEHARARRARIHAELIGYGLTSDAFHMTTPDATGRSWARCLSTALSASRCLPESVHYINAHGTGTPLNDSAETAAVHLAFGAHADRIGISSTKSMLGHCQFSAGAVEAVITVLAVRDQIMPPTMHLESPDPLCDLDYVAHSARPATIDVAGSSSFGFGGSSVMLLFRRVES